MIRLALIHIKSHVKQSIFTVLGVAISLSALLIATGIVNGLGNNTIKGLLTTSPHIKVENRYGDITNYKLKQEKILQIEGVDYSISKSIGRGIIKSENFYGTSIEGVRVEGVEEEAFKKFLSDNIVSGKFSYEGILIGEELANSINVSPGDEVTIVSHDNRSKTFDIIATYQTGFQSYDSSVVIIPLESSMELFNQKNISQIDVKIHDPYKAEEISKQIEQRLFLDASSWMKMNKQLLKVIVLDRNITLILFSLLLVFAGFIIYSLVSNVIRSKVKEIGILRAIGFSRNNILISFLYMGMILTLLGAILGIILNYIFYLFINNYTIDSIREVYYIPEKIPFDLKVIDILLNILKLSLVSFFSIALPSYRASILDPVNSIKK